MPVNDRQVQFGNLGTLHIFFIAFSIAIELVTSHALQVRTHCRNV